MNGGAYVHKQETDTSLHSCTHAHIKVIALAEASAVAFAGSQSNGLGTWTSFSNNLVWEAGQDRTIDGLELSGWETEWIGEEHAWITSKEPKAL